MIAVTTLMKTRRHAMDVIENAPNPNFDATMTSVFQAVGDVTMTMIVVMVVMKLVAKLILVQLANSNVNLDIASRMN